tara:strand:+ start:707 stop:1078 length:372 start_codon:yes stop_codon:yes gene_type:complete
LNALIIPLLLFPALAGFITIYPFAEYNYDCPTAIGNPIENENCTHTKHMIWIAVSTISLTEFGFPADCHIGICFWEETNNPDAYNNTSIIPVAIAFAVTAIIAWRSDRNNQNKFNKETTQALR